MKLTMILLLVGMLQVSASVYSQNGKISVDVKEMELSDLLWELQESSGIVFVYKTKDLKGLEAVTVNKQGSSLEDILDEVLEGTGLEYVFNEDVVTVRKINSSESQQQEKKEIKGKVVDEKGSALPGVTVQVQGTMNGVATDMKGRFSIYVKPNDALRVSFVGFKTQLILITDQEKLEVQLLPETENLQEVSVVAFGEQKKESVVSSITSVKAGALKSSSSDLTSTFAGKIAGVIGWQTGGMPGALTEEEMNTKFYIRGITSFQKDANISPLILLDGVEVSTLDLARIDPDDIETFNVMKDASATAMYGARGANGVIYVQTKKGEEGNVYTSFRYEKIWTKPTREIDVVSPIEYMKYYNKAVIGRDPSASPRYTAEKISRTASGDYPDYVYPNVDWYDQLFKNQAVNNHYALNVRGGTSKIQYYASVTHNNDEGMLKVDRLNQFDPNIKSKQTTFRANLNINLNKTAKLILTSFSTHDDYTGPAADVRKAYDLAFSASPVDFAPTYPKDELHDWPHIRFGGSNTSSNPYAAVQAGYYEKTRYSTINKFEYIQHLDKLIKGLEFRGSVSMNKVGYFSTLYTTMPAFYSLSNYDASTGEHSLTALNEGQASRTLRIDDMNSVSQTTTSMEYQAKAFHSAHWGDHQTSLTAVVYAREQKISTPRTVTQSLPQRNMGAAFRGSYGFKSKYFVEASVGINGSERFAEKNRVGAYPAFGAAWVASKENFFNSTSNWLDFLKFRFSYGRVGNDGVIKNPRFVYLENIAGDVGPYRQKSYPLAPAFYNIYAYGNPDTTWEIAETANFGTEIKLFNNLIDINFDLYQEIRHNIYSYRTTLPASMGLYSAPLDNIGKVRARGIDFSGKIQKAFSSDFWFILNGTFTYNKAKYLEIEEAAGKPHYQRKKGREISQQFGYIAEGLFQDQDEINSSPFQSGKVQPGDIKYRDVDENGMIDVNDAVPIGHPETPRIIYGFSGTMHYKGLEFNIGFQGSGDRSFWINPKEVSPFYENKALLTAFAKDHWTAENQKNMPLWPRLSNQNIIEHNPQEDYYADDASETRKSTYFMRNGRFLRCTNIELGYYLPKSWLEKIKMKKVKIYCRANNPFIISDFKLWDVELGESGFNYPIQKTYSLGVNMSF